MTPTQRAAALRLIEFETLPRRLLDIACRVRVNECLFHDDEFVEWVRPGSGAPPEAVVVRGDEVLGKRVVDAASCRAADWALCLQLAKGHQGLIDGWLNWRVSMPITRRRASTRVTPNQVTLASTAVGLAAASELARPFAMALPSFLQHLTVLEAAGIVSWHKAGRTRTFQLAPAALGAATTWLNTHRSHWQRRLDQLDELLIRSEPGAPDPNTNP